MLIKNVMVLKFSVVILIIRILNGLMGWLLVSAELLLTSWTLRKNYLIQFVGQPTHYRPSYRPSTLDLIIGSDDFIDNIQYLSSIGKSDHSILYFRSSAAI